MLYKIVEGNNPFITTDDIMHEPLSLYKSYLNSFFFISGALNKKREKKINFEIVWDNIWMRKPNNKEKR